MSTKMALSRLNTRTRWLLVISRYILLVSLHLAIASSGRFLGLPTGHLTVFFPRSVDIKEAAMYSSVLTRLKWYVRDAISLADNQHTCEVVIAIDVQHLL